MAKNNPDAATIAAIAVATVVVFHTANVFVGRPQESLPEPTAVITAKEKQPMQVPTEATAPTNTTPPMILYDVPLPIELQLHIIEVAESYGIDPAIIFAMCYRESSFDPDSIGDYGAAFGLMQIQPRWHSDRMARLGCTDLLDPYQNVIVGVDYLAEQMARYGGDVSKALVAYNAGHYTGTITKYAQEVLEIAEELRSSTYKYTMMKARNE